MSSDTNMKDPRVRAELYMASHGIKELFDGLGTLLLYHRPAKPREFLIQQLEEMQNAKQAQRHVRTKIVEVPSYSSLNEPFNLQVPFFDESDLQAMFAAFDIKEQGFISMEQYDQALLNLGIEKPSLCLPESVSMISQSLFVRSLYALLSQNFIGNPTRLLISQQLSL